MYHQNTLKILSHRYVKIFAVLLLLLNQHSHTFHVWKWAVGPKNSRTLQPQWISAKQNKKLQLTLPIVKKEDHIFWELRSQTPLVVQENVSRAKMSSVVWQASLWYVNEKDLISSETMKYVWFRVLIPKKSYLVQKMCSVVKPQDIFNSEFWQQKKKK